VFISGDKDTSDDKARAFASLVPAAFWDATNYFYANGIEGFAYGEGAYEEYGAISFGGGFDFKKGNISSSIIAAYHMAAAETPSDEGAYGLELNVDGKYKLADAANLILEFDLFMPGKFFGDDLAPNFVIIAGPEVKW